MDFSLPGGVKLNTAQMEKFGQKRQMSHGDFRDITPEQEYYIGRSVSAVILSKYETATNKRTRQYLNTMGNALAQASDRPETFSGYRFLVLDSDEINAMAAPGGFIFVTRGLLACCKTEDAIAAVLAHEIAHIQRKHALRAIHKSRQTKLASDLVIPGTSTYSKGTLSDLTHTFDKSISDIMTTLTDSGYSHKQEDQADRDAVAILQRLGYNPNCFIDALQLMQSRSKTGDKGFPKTHPNPGERIRLIKEIIGGYTKPKIPAARTFRFMAMTGGM
ncbi:M48 family metalloprotease [uncultured Pseudodesulfovibrio sp.]|uniref:M48 family metalloprotease n=1 Tax=uncultured Pseudodesulfovibrio sp. TaxID=2035858 RepID=UPI0029C89E8F|nr:M48 family metalloprotease [uncultured Pseudodesulfovibrio sp.]